MKVNNKEEFDKQNIFGKGEANTAFADYFIGNSFLNPLTHPGNVPCFWQMLHLSQDAAITGISIMQKAAAGRC